MSRGVSEESGDKVSCKESGFQGSGKVRENSDRVPEDSRRVQKVPEGPTLGGHEPRRYHMDRRGVQQPTWAGRT